MKPAKALFFSVVSILLLLGVSLAISYGLIWTAVLLGVIAFFFIGAGFIVKAKSRRGASPGTRE